MTRAHLTATESASERLEARSLGLHDSGRWVWRHLDFDLAAGERVALTGPSGSGKTALLLILAGLLEAGEGEIRLDGKAIDQWSMTLYRSRVGYLPQRPMLDEDAGVEEVLALPFEYRIHRQHSFPRDRVVAWLEALGRGRDFLERRVRSLSGGEQQLAALLRLLAVSPQVLLLDEPTAAMDEAISRQAETLLEQWRREEEGRGWLWVSHNADQVERIADRRLELP